ncbi:hypothetical protein [Polycladomyces subterraneus]|uniref:Uncharacterized protein n=1 Tax=Polycladomyces subterraneus TaxID=1016997 RepID=A0ABT8IM65_9BACL|nr:hypothetical protein [Polycladomyces subterraneus]MDN4593626.1 hypothetical protein [Polycladomyces subterraneus]
MAHVIPFERLQAAREERLRQEALEGFPWDQMDRFMDKVMIPTLVYLPEERQIQVCEALYRLAYEAFLLGLTASRSIFHDRRPPRFANRPMSWVGIYDEAYEHQGKALMQSIADEFSLSVVLADWAVESVWIAMEAMVPEWFSLGVHYGLSQHLEKR